MVGQITVDGVRFKVSGVSTDLPFAQNDIDDVVVPSVLVTLQNQNKLDIGQHQLPLPWGKILALGLDTAVIPAIDPTATSLADLLDNVVDCTGVGNNIASALGFGSGTFWASACLVGLDKAADAIYDQFLDSDTILGLDLIGSARAADTNNDYKIDTLTSGSWQGSMDYAGTPAALAQPASFIGKRM
jgi:hypothetical protein